MSETPSLPNDRPPEVDFRPDSGLPVLPTTPDLEHAVASEWVQKVQAFHAHREQLEPRDGLSPAAMLALASQPNGEHPFVVYYGTGGATALGLTDVLINAIEQVRPDPIVRGNLEHLVELSAEALANTDNGLPVADLLELGTEALAQRSSFGEDAAQTLKQAIASLLPVLPTPGPVYDLREGALLDLAADLLPQSRLGLRQELNGHIQKLLARLEAMMQLEEADDTGASAQASKLGALGDRVNDSALASALQSGRKGAQGMSEQRRSRVTSALKALNALDLEGDSVVWLLPKELPSRPTLEAANGEKPPLDAVTETFDALAAQATEWVRALRIAELEASNSYVEALHDAQLQQLNWEGFRPHELALIPHVVAVTTGQALRSTELSAFSAALRDSRPILILVLDESAATDEAQALNRFHFDLGALALAHGEAAVLRSSLSLPSTLVEGLITLSNSPRPRVAIAAMPQGDGPLRFLSAHAALHGRACPELLYDPDADVKWANCIDVGANPWSDAPWPELELPCLSAEEETSIYVRFTYADSVALAPAFRGHLAPIPPEAWDDSQMPLADWLDTYRQQGGCGAIPYLWFLDDEGTLVRSVVSRELAMASLIHLRAWQSLQQMAGLDNPHVAMAQRVAQDQAAMEAEQRIAELEAKHATELDELRQNIARETMERLAAALLSPDGLSGFVPTGGPSTPRSRAPAQEVAAANAPTPVAEPEEDDDDLGAAEAYIDSVLCTSCNDCINISAQVFAYNADKQAFIQDSSAGNFAVLVQAAEKCPSRCIHPGSPQSGDSSATPELIERAAQYN